MNSVPTILALASDYDATLAFEGKVAPETLEGLARFKASSRKLLLVTGRHWEDLLGIFPQINLFDCAVVENGAVLYWPSSRHIETLAPPPQKKFLDSLRQRGVEPLAVGRSIVATTQAHFDVVQKAISEMGIPMEIIFNRDAVMVVPLGVNKATGLAEALEKLRLSPEQVVGVGDAENDEAFLKLCGCSVAVANAIPNIKQLADITTQGEHGAGVVELIDKILAGKQICEPASRDLLGCSPGGGSTS